MSNRSKFLIVCPMRSGSTWLELLLKEVPGVNSDFEVKWAPGMQNYDKITHDLHIYLTSENMDVGDELESVMPEGNIIGSKLVLDHFDYSEESLESLKKTISKDIKIIFIWRHPTDIILSIKRGVSIKMNENAGDTEMENGLKKMQHIFNDRDYDSDFFFFDRKEFLEDTAIFARQHQWCKSLSDHVDGYLEVDYNEINRDFTKIVRFIGSDESSEILDGIKNNPITVKTGPKEVDKFEYVKKQTNLGVLAYFFDGKTRLNYSLLLFTSKLIWLFPQLPRKEKILQVAKALKSTVNQSTTQKTIKRIQDPLWINSNGQSGTNLIKKLFSLLDMELTQSLNITADSGYVCRIYGEINDFPGFDPESQLLVGVNWPGIAKVEDVKKRFCNSAPNSFGAGHMLYTPAAGRMFSELGYKVILIIREPKDWVYSNARRFMEANEGKVALDMDYCLKKALFGESPDVGRGRYPMIDRYEGMSGWMQHDNVCVVKFENLVGKKGGGCDDLLFNEMDLISNHLNIELSKKERQKISDNLFGGTKTFRFGKIGKWEEQAGFFEDPEVKELVSKAADLFGYK